jgi:trigger factor
MRKQHANWKEVTRSAQEGDKLIVDLQGLVNGEPDLGMQKEGTFFVLDTETMASPFGALKDAKAGDKITIDLPAMEGATASKQVIVQVQKVEEPELPVLDDSFAERLEVEGGLTALRAEVKKSMEERLEQSIKNELKGQLIDILLEQYQFELPKTLVDAELKRISNQRRNQQEAASAATLLKSAEDGVRLGLIYSEVIKQHGIKADEARIRAHVQRVASMFNGSPEIINMLYKDKKMMNNFYSQVLEEQIIEKLLEQVQYEEEAANYLDVIKLNEAEYNADFYDEDEGEDEHEQCDHSDCDHDHHGHAHHEHAE